MKATESTNIYVSVRVVCTIKVNVKNAFMRNDSFLQMFMWSMHCSQRIKDLLFEKFSV